MGEEKRFEEKIKAYLKDNGCWFVKYFANSYTPVGIPDILACVNGYFVAIEVKASKGRSTDLQRYNRSIIRKSGGISIILYPNQFEDFKLLIQDLLNGRNFQTIFEEQHFFD